MSSSDAFSVGSVAVHTTINHPYLSDVELTLTHAGRTVTLEHGNTVPNELSGQFVFTDTAVRGYGLSQAGFNNLPAGAGYYHASNNGVLQSLNDHTTGFGGVTSTGPW